MHRTFPVALAALATLLVVLAVAPATASAVELGAGDDMWAGYRPDVPASMAAHGMTWMRLVAYQDEPLDRTLRATGQARAAGLRVSVVLTPRYGAAPGARFATWAGVTSARLAAAGVERVSLLNEPDLWLPAADRCDSDTEVRSTLRSEHVTSRRVRAWVRTRVLRWRMVRVHRHWHFRRVPVTVRRRRMATRITRTPTSTQQVALTPRWGCLEIHRARMAADIWQRAIPAVRAAAPGLRILIGETSPVTGVGLFLRALDGEQLPRADGWAHHPYPSSTVELGLDHADRLGRPFGLAVYWTEVGTHVRTDEHAQPLEEARENWRQAVAKADRLGVLEVDAYGWLATGKRWDTAAEGVIF